MFSILMIRLFDDIADLIKYFFEKTKIMLSILLKIRSFDNIEDLIKYFSDETDKYANGEESAFNGLSFKQRKIVSKYFVSRLNSLPC